MRLPHFLFFLLLGLTQQSYGLGVPPTTMAIVDTEFCFANLKVPAALQNNIIIRPTYTKAKACPTKVPKETWAHGHHVLQLFIQELSKNLFPNQVIEIFPYNIFQEDGSYKLKDWEVMLAKIRQHSPQIIMMASTYYGPDHATLESSMKNFQGVFLLAAGAKDPTIQNPAYLWPQTSLTLPKILFGSYIVYRTKGQKGAIQGQLDTGLIEQNGLDFIVQSPKSGTYPTGSSFAVARASGFILGQCHHNEKAQLIRCLEGKSREILLKSHLKASGKIYKALTFSK